MLTLVEYIPLPSARNYQFLVCVLGLRESIIRGVILQDEAPFSLFTLLERVNNVVLLVTYLDCPYKRTLQFSKNNISADLRH